MKKNKILFSVDPIMKEYYGEFEENLKKYFTNPICINGSDPLKDRMSFFIKKVKVFSRYKGTFGKIFRKKYQNYLQNHYEELIEEHKDSDYLLAVGGVYYSDIFLKKLKQINPNIRTIAFLWDNFSKEIILSYKRNYDVVYTFERDIATKYDMKFRPSFYVEKIDEKKEIDCYYVGTLREKDRYYKIKEMYEFCKRNNLKSYLKLFVEKDKMKSEFKNSKILSKKKISYKTNLEYSSKSKVIIELNYKNQKGLTLRSLECIGLKSKLITENKDIKNYDFYDSENIYIIDDLDSIKNIPIDFFNNEYKPLIENIEKKYSLEGFLKEIFKEGEHL